MKDVPLSDVLALLDDIGHLRGAVEAASLAVSGASRTALVDGPDDGLRWIANEAAQIARELENKGEEIVNRAKAVPKAAEG